MLLFLPLIEGINNFVAAVTSIRKNMICLFFAFCVQIHQPVLHFDCIFLDHRKPTVTSVPSSGIGTENGEVVLTCNHDSNGVVSYAWTKTGSATNLGTGQELRLTPLKKQDKGEYVCTTSVSGFQSLSSDGFNVTVGCEYMMF